MAAEAVAVAAVEILLEKMLTLSAEQIGLVLNFKDDLEKLQQAFSMVKAFLIDAEKKQATEAVKVWLRNLEALAFKADNVFDEVIYRLMSKKVRATTKEKVKSFFPCSSKNPIAYRLKLGRRIKNINDKLDYIHQHARNLGLQEIAAQAPAYASESIQTDSVSEDPIFHGRNEEVSTIVEKLVTASQSEQKLSVLPIVGMGGLGKTTLARKVFNHEQIKSHFGDQQRVWVHVPRTFDHSVLFERILTSMGIESHVPQGNRQALVKKLQEHLDAKKYLLVLDDVWNDNRLMWESFKDSLLGISSAAGNCIIVTTRKHETASIVNTLQVHELKCLSNEDCWSIIEAKASIREGDEPSELKAIGINIAEKCQGLPLAAKVVGGLLRGKPIDEWRKIQKNWLSDDENPIPKILKLSFDNLSPPSLKKCFAYCSIFPKGYEIKKEQLVELWMAEGFLQSDPQRSNTDMETIGNKLFNILLQNSLLQVVRSDDYDNVTHCNMHDLVHDMTFSILYENDKDTDVIFHSRYIGHKSSGDGFLSIAKGQEKYARTLFVNGKVSDIRFSDFESLHTLTLGSEEDINDLPASIRKLKHLRYLDISRTRINSLSDSIAELYHLQTLRVANFCLKKLPDSLRCLVSLRHLHISKGTTLPPEIGKLTSLQTLSYFHVRSEKGYGISELGNLKDLKGKLNIRNLENVRDREEAMSAYLLRKEGIYELGLEWDKFREGDKANDKSVLEGLQPHSNLKILKIRGFKGESLPLLEGLNNLVEIKLEECSECEELPMLGHLPHLKYLYLVGLSKVTSIRCSFYGNIDNCKRDAIIDVFRALERLELKNMSNLKEWDEVGLPLPSQVFPRLKYLKIEYCWQLSRAPSHFPCLEELKIVVMESGSTLKNICGIKLSSLRNLHIRGIEGLECLPDWLFSNNPNLTNLEIINCPKMTHLVPHLGGSGAPSLLEVLSIWDCRSLRELPDDLHSLSSLELLNIIKCPDLKLIPYYPISSRGVSQQQQLGFTSLRWLYIKDCSGLTNLPIGMVESCAKSLEELELVGLRGITNFPMVIGCLHRMTRLRKLIIKEVPKFSSKDINGSLISLQELTIIPSSSDSSWNNVSFNEAVVAIMLPQSIGSLRCLELHGKEDWDSLLDQLQHLTSLEDWDSLPDQLQHLTSRSASTPQLQHLTSRSASTPRCLELHGIEALPEWFGNLSSLKGLSLLCCKKLKHLPSKQAMQRLSKLTNLSFNECPLLLKEENRSNNNIWERRRPQIVDSEWPNISHIPTVKVDFVRVSSDE